MISSGSRPCDSQESYKTVLKRKQKNPSSFKGHLIQLATHRDNFLCNNHHSDVIVQLHWNTYTIGDKDVKSLDNFIRTAGEFFKS